MRATGIVRRIDDLGRVVIPKEIRRRIGVHEGDPLEIYLDGRNTVCFHKYNTNLYDEVDCLKNQIEAYLDVPYDAQEKIETLFNEIQKLIKDEE